MDRRKNSVLIVEESKQVAAKPKPDLTGLQVHEIEVNGDDPRWQRTDRAIYTYCNDKTRIGDFPVTAGKRTVRYTFLPAEYFNHDPSNQEVIDEVARLRGSQLFLFDILLYTPFG